MTVTEEDTAGDDFRRKFEALVALAVSQAPPS
jgi:hypothetical protein